MDDCIFCRIVSGETPSKKVYEDARSMAFLDINPRNPGHTLVVPKRHVQDIFSIPEDDVAELMKTVKKVAAGVMKATGAKGMSIAQSNGQLAGQVVPHMHVHVIPRTEKEKGIGLEGVLPVKQQDEASLDSMARRIAGSITGGSRESPGEPEAPEQEEKEEGPPRARRPGSPDEQPIDFDF
jgi:histidine triad (HIT) family protein